MQYCVITNSGRGRIVTGPNPEAAVEAYLNGLGLHPATDVVYYVAETEQMKRYQFRLQEAAKDND